MSGTESSWASSLRWEQAWQEAERRRAGQTVSAGPRPAAVGALLALLAGAGVAVAVFASL